MLVDFPFYFKISPKETHVLQKRRFPIDILLYRLNRNIYRKCLINTNRKFTTSLLQRD